MAPRHGRVAALADVHGIVPALEAVLEELEREQPDLVVVCGDVAWGPAGAEALRRRLGRLGLARVQPSSP